MFAPNEIVVYDLLQFVHLGLQIGEGHAEFPFRLVVPVQGVEQGFIPLFHEPVDVIARLPDVPQLRLQGIIA